jgi:hypothetical protein
MRSIKTILTTVLLGVFLTLGCDNITDINKIDDKNVIENSVTNFSNSTANVIWQQDFNDNTNGWLNFRGTITHNPGSGTATVNGNAFDCPGYVQSRGINPCYGGAFSQNGEYRYEWPGTWIHELDIYLDTNPEERSIDGRWGFDLIVASSRNDGSNHLRDFVFHVGVVDGTGLVVNGSNNADLYTNQFKLQNDNGGNYYQVTESGWYTFQHVFYENNDGNLNVDLNLIKDDEVLWTAIRVTER